jgi:pyruvate,water dikinase
MRLISLTAVLVGAASLVGCKGGTSQTGGVCQIGAEALDGGAGPDGGTGVPDYLEQLGCLTDFQALSSDPLDVSIPGARSGKVVLDTLDSNHVYFQNSKKFQIHYQFASKYLSGPAHPIVPPLGDFNSTEYTSANRRFILGAITYYEGPKAWVLEIAPYDTADAEMIQTLFEAAKAHVYFSGELSFHPTSESVALVAKNLPSTIPIKTTDELFADIQYQPLYLGTSVGQLKFVKAADLATTYLGFRDIVVLDHVPNDIAVTAGMITEEFQTPLSHINILAQNRKTPNMGLRKATTNETLLALQGKWVSFTVGSQNWDVHEVTVAEADTWWEAHKPAPVTLPTVNVSVTDLRNVEDLVVEGPGVNLREAIATAILAFGTKASNYGVIYNTGTDANGNVLSLAKDAQGNYLTNPADPKITYRIPIRKAFAIPVFYYRQFMTQNGFFDRVDAMLADPSFKNDSKVRDTQLAKLRDDIIGAPVDSGFQAVLRAKLNADYPGETIRFRTSTNAEDLDGFPCAGCYDSHTGDPKDWEGSLLHAIKEAWSGVWFYRTFEERSFHSIDHKQVAMALLAHHNYPDEEANGVALTGNPFDPSGLQPALYFNVQYGGNAEVVHPPPGVSSDQVLYFYYNLPNRPQSYLGHSNLVPTGQTVLSEAQILELGQALDTIHKRFSPAYGPQAGNNGWYAMDCEFKFDDEDKPGSPPTLLIKQARPSPERGN